MLTNGRWPHLSTLPRAVNRLRQRKTVRVVGDSYLALQQRLQIAAQRLVDQACRIGILDATGRCRFGSRYAQPDAAAREALFQQLLAQQYAKGSALNMAATLEIDAVIDPADTRDWLLKGLQGQPALTSASHLAIDSW